MSLRDVLPLSSPKKKPAKSIPATCSYSPDRLRQAETCVSPPVHSLCWVQVGGLCARKDTDEARSNRQNWPRRHRKRVRPWTSTQARGLLIPCFNLTSIIRMPDSASNVKDGSSRWPKTKSICGNEHGPEDIPGVLPEARGKRRGGRSRKRGAPAERHAALDAVRPSPFERRLGCGAAQRLAWRTLRCREMHCATWTARRAQQKHLVACCQSSREYVVILCAAMLWNGLAPDRALLFFVSPSLSCAGDRG